MSSRPWTSLVTWLFRHAKSAWQWRRDPKKWFCGFSIVATIERWLKMSDDRGCLPLRSMSIVFKFVFLVLFWEKNGIRRHRSRILHEKHSSVRTNRSDSTYSSLQSECLGAEASRTEITQLGDTARILHSIAGESAKQIGTELWVLWHDLWWWERTIAGMAHFDQLWRNDWVNPNKTGKLAYALS